MAKMCDILHERLKEEIKDVLEYAKLAEDAEAIGDPYIEHQLKKIAYDEFTHALALKTILTERGHEIDAETAEHWRRAKKAMKEL
jgi:rubrerythrin